MSSCCALTSCTQIQSGCAWATHASTPLLAAERMPLRLRLVSLNKEFPMVAASSQDTLAQDFVLFGPAYKGIPLAAAVAIELARAGRNVPYAYNRKEAKDHGEGGHLVGAPVRGRVLIVDDVMSAGTAARESIALIRAAGATPHAVAIALDRQEKATEDGRDVDHSAVQYVQRQLGLQVCAIARLADLLQYLGKHAGGELGQHHGKVLAYRQMYGVDENNTSTA